MFLSPTRLMFKNLWQTDKKKSLENFFFRQLNVFYLFKNKKNIHEHKKSSKSYVNNPILFNFCRLLCVFEVFSQKLFCLTSEKRP